jgi:hypothetical protein
MARKHNTKHSRTRSHYPERLQRRGVSSASVRMPDLDTLRAWAARRARGQDPHEEA